MARTQEAKDRQAAGGPIAAERLRSLVDRIEHLESDKKAICEDIRDIYTVAKSEGFDPKVIRRLVSERKMDPGDFEEQEMLIDTYRRALGPYVEIARGSATPERVQ